MRVGLIGRPGVGGVSLWPLLVVGLGTLVVPLDSAVNIDFPFIVRHFDLPIPMIQWVVISYVLTQTSLLLVFGRIGDMLGYRRIFLIGTGWSTLAFLACALAPSYPMLLLARVAQGIGAGLILSCGPALATSLFPEAMRTRTLGLYTMMFGIGGALGPSVFGLLVERFGWSAVFSFRAPIALAAFLLAWLLPVPSRPAHREAFDAAGGAFLALGLSFMLLALNQMRNLGEANLWPVLCVGLSVAGFVLFARQERRCDRPIIDLRYFRSADFTAINLAHALINLSAFAIMLLAPFYLSVIARMPVPLAGLVLATSPLGIALAAPLAGRLAARHQPRLVALLGALASAAGLFGISTAGADADTLVLIVSMFVQGFGVGLFQVAYFDILTVTIPREDRGVAGALGMATRSIGVVTGATVLMLIFQTLRATSGLAEPQAFLAGFQGTFRIAAVIPAVLVLLGLMRRFRS
jgi:EmrB/QacA subfamily drug resistance transporter